MNNHTPRDPLETVERTLGEVPEELKKKYREDPIVYTLVNTLHREAERFRTQQGKEEAGGGGEDAGCDHDWRPDGESWRERVDDCPFDQKRCDGNTKLAQAAHDNIRCVLQHDHEYVRKRRYTCHCGATKTVTLK